MLCKILKEAGSKIEKKGALLFKKDTTALKKGEWLLEKEYF